MTTPEPPYWAVIFSSTRAPGVDGLADEAGYQATAARMEELAASVPGYLGIESARDTTGFGITVSYWASPEAIAVWRDQVEHVAARERGRERWYDAYELRVARVERAYGWKRSTPHP